MIATMYAGVRVLFASLITVGLGVALLLPGSGRPIVVGVAPTTDASPAPPAIEGDPSRAALLGELTADDVARGVWALAATTDGPALSPAQRDRLLPLVERASQLRAALGERRTEHRATERVVLADGVSLAEALGTARLTQRPPGPAQP